MLSNPATQHWHYGRQWIRCYGGECVMKRVKQLLCSLLVVCMVIAGITVMPQNVHAATASGDDGEIHWKIKGDTLTLSAVTGTKGRMKDYDWNILPKWLLSSQIKAVKNIILDANITKIGTFAFNGTNSESKLGEIDTMTILCNATIIPGYFCAPCDIKQIVIGGNIETIEQYAFSCTFTESIFIGKKTKNIGEVNFGASFGVDGYATELKSAYGYNNSGISKYIKFWNKGLSLGSKWFYFDEDGDGNDDEEIFLWRPNENGKKGFSLINFYSIEDNKSLSSTKVSSAYSVNKGQSKNIKVVLPEIFNKVTKYTGNPCDVKVTYKSSNKAVATVSTTGKVTGKKKGTAKIIVTMQIKNGAKKTVTTKVTVK